MAVAPQIHLADSVKLIRAVSDLIVFDRTMVVPQVFRGDAKLKAHLDAVRAPSAEKVGPFQYPHQWSDKDFEPVAAEFDKLFAKKGWIK